MKCPKTYKLKVFTMNNKDKDKMTMFAFVRDTWKRMSINDSLYPPHYLIKLMSRYYLNEFVHLFDREGKHWKVDVFDIIS